jgi:4-hydroxybenzoate polyprenyltransferase
MGLGKRYGEVKLLEHNGSSFRKTLGGYTPELLSHMLNVTSALTIVCFLLYSMDARTKLTFGTDNLVFTVPLVLYCIFRFSVLIQKGTYSGPVTVLIHDRPFQIGLALWAAACMGIIYANRLGISLSDIVTY